MTGSLARAPRPLTRRQRRLAFAVALVADLVQVALLPLFSSGVGSPFDWGVDLVAAVVLVRTLGWHVALLPTFVAELLPFVDLFPTWTVAVWIATRGRADAPGGAVPAGD